jgi:hypothetical protein
MFILKRQDVELSSIQHPSKEQPIPILQYQGQTFRLINVFSAAQETEAKAVWRDLTDHRGKACVLLEEPERYSIWGKIRLDQLDAEPQRMDSPSSSGGGNSAAPALVKGTLLLLQAVYFDIEDMLGNRQITVFQKEITAVFQQGRFPQAQSSAAVQELLTVDPLAVLQVPPWHDNHLYLLLQELHRLGKKQFGNANFSQRALEALDDMPSADRNQFLTWLKRSPSGKLWQ